MCSWAGKIVGHCQPVRESPEPLEDFSSCCDALRGGSWPGQAHTVASQCACMLAMLVRCLDIHTFLPA